MPIMITERQIPFLTSLRTERNIPTTDILTLSKDDANKEIKRLLATPRPPRVASAQPTAFDAIKDLPACMYIIDGDGGQPVHIEVVERKNRYGTRRYLNLLIGAPGDWNRSTRLSNETIKTFAAKIKAARYFDEVGQQNLEGPEAAAVRFSREHKCCAACNSPLSDTKQPGYLFGLGPVCRKRFGH